MKTKITEVHKQNAVASFDEFEMALYSDHRARSEGEPTISTYEDFDEAFGFFEFCCKNYPCVELRGVTDDDVEPMFIGGTDSDLSEDGEAIL